MNNINLAFLFTFIAGVSTLFGLLPILFNIKNNDKIISYSLAFASGVMLSISIFDLIPSSIKYFSIYYNYSLLIISFFMFIGISFSLLVDYFINKYSNNSLYRVGLISFIGLIIHNIPEGIITFVTTSKDLRLGLSLMIAILMHNIPEGISIGIPIYYASNSKIKAFLYVFIAGISEFFGAIITFLFLKFFINNIIIGILFSMVSGIMIYISLIDLLYYSLKNSGLLSSFFFFIIGFVFMFVNLLLL